MPKIGKARNDYEQTPYVGIYIFLTIVCSTTLQNMITFLKNKPAKLQAGLAGQN